MSETGLVTSVGSRSVRVAVRGHGQLRATLRGNLWAAARDEKNPVAVGDRVTVTLAADECVIDAVLPRKNAFVRPQAAGRFSGRTRKGEHGKSPPVQVIAANIDRMLVVAALDDPPFRPGLVDRFCVAAAMQGLTAQVVLNKVDLPGDRGVVQPWADAGYRVHATSTTTGEGIAGLRAEMSDGVSLLVGHSGVGKSSLLNAVDPRQREDVGTVADYHGRGKHTTVAVTLLPLACGGFVVDSPGIRELALSAVTPSDLARLFPGFGELPDGCRFRDCLHQTEPDCAVRAAIASDRLPAARHATYVKILEDLQGGLG